MRPAASPLAAVVLTVSAATHSLAQSRIVDLRAGEQALTIHGAAPSDGLGGHFFFDNGSCGVAVADLNADGRPDMALTSSGGGPEPDRPGRVDVVFGPIAPGPDVDLAARPGDVVVLGPWAAGTLMALAVGDLNGDGADDLAVSAADGWGPTGRRIQAGSVHVLFGPLPPGVRDLRVQPADVVVHGVRPWTLRLPLPVQGDMFGYRLLVADVTNDGRPDLVVGEPGWHPTGATREWIGRAHVFFGPVAPGTRDLLTSTADLTVTGDPGGLGSSLGAGDVSGDGVTDLIVGADFSDAGDPAGGRRGQVHVLFGPVTAGTRDLMTAPADVRLRLEGRFSERVAFAAGDFDADGDGDLAVGGLPSGLSEVRVLAGPLTAGVRDLRAQPANWILDSGDGDHLGEAVLAAADVDGDGLEDLVMGAHWAWRPDRSEFFAGEVFAVLSPLPAPGRHFLRDPALPTLRVLGARGEEFRTRCWAFGDNLGLNIAAADVTGDCIADLVLGRPNACGPGDTRPWAGAVHVVEGQPRGAGDRCTRPEHVSEVVRRVVGDERVARSLLSKSTAAERALERGQPEVASHVLCALLHELRAQEGKAIDRADAAAIRWCTRAVLAELGEAPCDAACE